MLTLTGKGFFTKVEGPYDERKVVHRILSIFDPSSKHNPGFKSGEWDGYYHLYDEEEQTFLSGLQKYVVQQLQESGVEVTSFFNELTFPLPDVTSVLPTVLDGVMLRDYQVRACKKVLLHKGGVVASPTGSGKGTIAAALVKILDRKSLTMVHTRLLAKQTAKRYKSGGVPKVGLITDGIFKPGKHTVATVQSLYAGLTNEYQRDEVVDFLKKQEVLMLDECFPHGTTVVVRGANGKPVTEKIGILVEKKYTGDVLSFNFEANEWQWRKVTNHFQLETQDEYFHYMRTRLYEQDLHSTQDHKFPIYQTEVKKVDTEATQIFPEDVVYLLPVAGKIPPALGSKQRQALVGLVASGRAKIGWKGDTTVNLNGVSVQFRENVLKQFDPEQLIYVPETGIGFMPRTYVAWTIRRRCYDKHTLVSSKLPLTDYGLYFLHGGEGTPHTEIVADTLPYALDELLHVDRQVWSPDKTVFNITVEGNHNYVADGILSCNCHRAPARSWRMVASYLDNPLRVGLSGTPFRGRGRDQAEDLMLRGLCGDLVYEMPVALLKELGHIADPVIYSVPIYSPRIDKMKVWTTVYQKGIVENDSRNRFAVEAVSRLLRDDTSKVLLLVSQIDHGQRVLQMLDANGIEAWMLKGAGEFYRMVNHVIESFNDSPEDSEVLKQFSAGEFRVLIATQVLDEGVDLPEVDSLILLGGGKSHIKTIQRIGRVLRPKPGTNKAYVVDFMDKQHPWLTRHSYSRLGEYKEDGHEVLGAYEFDRDFPLRREN